MDRILPPKYVRIWRECTKRKEERDLLEAEWEENRKQIAANKAKKEKHRPEVNPIILVCGSCGTLDVCTCRISFDAASVLVHMVFM